MEQTTILAGLPETKEFWASIDMLRYLLLLAGLDAVCGIYISKVTQQCELFTLPRSGYARWYHRAMLGASGAVCLLLLLITGLAGLTSGDSTQTVLLAGGLLLLNMVVIANIELLITLLSQKIALGYLVCMFVQLLSLFGSDRFSHAGKLLLIGNWGMLIRSTWAGPDGIPLKATVPLEILILILLWIFGWRILRRNRRGVSYDSGKSCIKRV
jgi:hypothetical protein